MQSHATLGTIFFLSLDVLLGRPALETLFLACYTMILLYVWVHDKLKVHA